ncbi:FecR family protein [Sphingomonas melonis]|uniref:Transmembrane sensor n=1 Tax=Sphingomonas melonis TaxID=152682 RepID=A0A7Y9FKT4_9SPHN|nr:FecR domain-containing protein [Sphingomonas melonis]NYD89153.1 transmembrane sensor [Sphingomonas melonis]
MSPTQEAQDAAAKWIIRRDNGVWSESDQIELEGWLAASDRNKAAYWRLSHSWREADRIGALGVSSARRGVDVRPRRALRPMALAASLALAIGFGASSYLVGRPDAQAETRRFVTPVGVQRAVTLADGTNVELNTSTTVRTAVSHDSRTVWLDDGEAFFSVARDAEHPFVIFAGAKRITVLGTKFSVRRAGGRMTVSVLEGRVRIDDADVPASAGANSSTITGGVLAVTDGASTLVTQKSEARVADALAWRNGLLKFDHVRLADVAKEFNRYNRRQMVIDMSAAGIPIGGSFRATNMEAFTRLLGEAYHLQIAEDGDRIIISS